MRESNTQIEGLRGRRKLRRNREAVQRPEVDRWLRRKPE
jgi:hypothetical protein